MEQLQVERASIHDTGFSVSSVSFYLITIMITKNLRLGCAKCRPDLCRIASKNIRMHSHTPVKVIVSPSTEILHVLMAA